DAGRAPRPRLAGHAQRDVGAGPRRRHRAPSDRGVPRDDGRALTRTRELRSRARGSLRTGDADLHDPACVRATMGALDALELVRTTPRGLVALVRRSRGKLVGAAPDGARSLGAAVIPTCSRLERTVERVASPPDGRLLGP